MDDTTGSGSGGDDVAALMDRAAIIDLTVAYGAALDERDWDGVAAVFLPDATAVYTDREHSSAEEIVTRCREGLGRCDASHHMITNQLVQLDGDQATCRSTFQAQHIRTPEAGGNFIIAGTYEDDLVRTPDGWRISHRVLTSVWREGEV